MYYLYKPLDIKNPVDVYIESGSTLNSTLIELKKNSLISGTTLPKILVRSYCFVTKSQLHAGSFRFDPTNKTIDVLKALVTGSQAHTVRVTFPEGIMLTDFARILQRNIALDSAEFMRLATSDSMAKAHSIPAPTLEGYLYPNTYDFYWKQPADKVLEFLLNEQNKLWNTKFEELSKKKNKTRHEILTLASIVEAETPKPEERPTVAGVYSNRLRIGMKLDADPTVQYAIGSQRRLLYSDLDIDNRYNTYKYSGLPPGPINNPSATAIASALSPEEHSYLYFCAKGDGSNTHSFATTGTEHMVNVARYRRNRRAER